MLAGLVTSQVSLSTPPSLEVGSPTLSPLGTGPWLCANAAGTSTTAIQTARTAAITTLLVFPLTKKVHLRGLLNPHLGTKSRLTVPSVSRLQRIITPQRA